MEKVDLMEKDKVVKLARSYAANGFLCSESVLLAISDWLEIKNDMIPRIATGFGGGICFCGLVCGAVSGGIMALSVKFGRNDAKEQKVDLYQLGHRIVEGFEKEFGSVMCRELTECDFHTEAGRKEYADRKLWETKCREYIAGATAIVFDLIAEKRAQQRGCKELRGCRERG